MIIGTQWGDEGKGKIIDYLSSKYDIVVRFQGGNNAGHTINVKDEVHKLHLIPSGVIHPGKKLVIGNGTVLDLEVLKDEIARLNELGYDRIDLNISDRANIIMPYHRAADNVQEENRGSKSIGTTGRGIGPAYVDKVARRGIRMCDLLEPDILLDKIENGLDHWEATIKTADSPGVSFESNNIFKKYRYFGEHFRPYIKNTSRLINKAIDAGAKVLFEGAQGVMLDIDFGTYPFVTSSHTISGSVSIGSGVGPTKIKDVFGVMKAYTTRVGEGPFPTELRDENGRTLQKKGREIGTTTGRERRCGWLDLVVLKHSVMVGGVTAGVLTKIDVLENFDEIKVCTHYEIDGKKTDEFPPGIRALNTARPVYTTLQGPIRFDEGTIKNIKETGRAGLSKNISAYIGFIEKELSIPIKILSYGPKRSETCEI